MMIACLLLALVAVTLAARISIDAFTTNTPSDTSSLTYDPLSAVRSPQSAFSVDAAVLGGFRAVYITSAGGIQGNTAVTSQCEQNPPGIQGNPNAKARAQVGLSLSNPIAQCNGGAFARYDGVGAPQTPGCNYYSQNCLPTGRLNINFNQATSITVRAGADLANTYFAVYLYSGSDNRQWCGVFQKIDPATSATGVEYTFPISQFSTPKNPPNAGNDLSGLGPEDFPQTCNLAAINAVDVQLVGGFNWDQILKTISYDVPDLISISGNAFDDCGCVGSTSSPKNGVSVSLFSGSAATGTPLSTVTTSGNGGFSFGSLTPGTYTVSVASGSLCTSSSNTITRTFSTSQGGLNFFYQVAGGIITCPAPRDLTCSADTSVGGQNGNAQFTGACGAVPTITSSDSVVNNPCTPGGVTRTITRTFSAGGQQCTQILTVRDDRVAPTLVQSSIPPARTIGCTDNAPTEVPTATGSSCNTVTVTVVESTGSAGQCDVNTCSRSSVFTRTFTPVDNCGNSGASAVQTITRNCATTCPTCPAIPNCPTFVPTVPVTQAPRPVVGPLNCKFICDDADSSAVATMVSLLVVVVLAVFAL